MNKETFYITTAIAYASKTPHIGNSYEIIMADAIARYKKSMGYDVYFLTGTDEHGQKIEDLAIEAKISPQKYVDNVAGEIRELFDFLNVEYDQFIRTTDDKHKTAVQKIFKKFYDKGDIYKGKYEGLYCIPCETFFTETQLVDNKCPDCGREVKKTSEEAYFFKMSNYGERLLNYIEENPSFIQPESRKREMVNNFLKPGLQDLCVSRTSFKWGIPVAFDTDHVVYVWIDALSNYITALGYLPEDETSPLFQKFWPADVHVIGKDILRFHTIYWPIMLMSLGLPMPKQVLGHPWLLSGNDKMSKSKGNVIYAKDLAKHFSVDGVRYYLLSEMPYANDGTLTYESVLLKYNADLANTIGNLVNRTVAMTNKYFGGEILPMSEKTDLDNEFISTVMAETKKYISKMDEYKIADASNSIMNIGRRANKYIDETTPWVLGKDDDQKDRLGTVLYCLLESIRYIGVLIEPFMPETSTSIFSQLNISKCDMSSLETFGQLVSGENVNQGTPLFARLDEKIVLEAISKENEANAVVKEEKQAEEENNLITIDKFFETELKVAEIIECEPVKKSDKLYKLQVNDGQRIRQVISGIKESYTEEELVGKKVILVANLKPAKLRGEISEGMILASDNNGKVAVVFIDETVENGSKVR